MRISIRFFLWKLEIKTKKLNSEDKIKVLLNELVKTIQETGNMGVNLDGFGCASIWIHNANTPTGKIKIEDVVNEWSFSAAPTFILKQK